MSLQNILKPNLYEIYADNITTENINTITINDQPYPPVIPPPYPILQSNKILRTNTAATNVFWGDVPHGLPFQILHTNNSGTNSEWTSNLDVPSTLSVAGLTTLNDTNLTANVLLNGDVGTVGQTIISNGASPPTWGSPAITAGSITPGTANQVLQTNATGTNTIWSTGLNIPLGNILAFNQTLQGNLGVINGNINVTNVAGQVNVTGGGSQINCNGTTTTSGLNVINQIRLNGNPGSPNQVLVSGGPLNPSWRTLNDVRILRYCAACITQNISNASVIPLEFNTLLTPVYERSVSSFNNPVGDISLSGSTDFRIAFRAFYDIDINLFFDPASTGIGNTFVAIYLEINGIENGSTCVSSSQYGCHGKIPNIELLNGDVVRIVVTRLGGVDDLVLFDFDPANAPKFGSTICFSIVDTI